MRIGPHFIYSNSNGSEIEIREIKFVLYRVRFHLKII